MEPYVLRVHCPDRPGIVAAIAQFLYSHGGNITDSAQHSESDRGGFFLRQVIEFPSPVESDSHFQAEIESLFCQFDVRFWDLSLRWDPLRTVIFCSRNPHCLYDLLLREQLQEFNVEITHVVANHPDIEEVAHHFNKPFTYIPVTPDARDQAENEQLVLLADLKTDLVVLARYMQILSPAFLERYPNRILNIHHSFLPAFVGARPYHQAHRRGVKVIGATAHYVTEELDAGPIISQDVTTVSHRDEVSDLVRKGRDVERQVLARAVHLHSHHHLIVEGNRTVVLGD